MKEHSDNEEKDDMDEERVDNEVEKKKSVGEVETEEDKGDIDVDDTMEKEDNEEKHYKKSP